MQKKGCGVVPVEGCYLYCVHNQWRQFSNDKNLQRLVGEGQRLVVVAMHLYKGMPPLCVWAVCTTFGVNRGRMQEKRGDQVQQQKTARGRIRAQINFC
jgi:hypothetical protein